MKSGRPEIPRLALELPERIIKEMSRAIVGKRDLIEDLLVALMAEGHVILEGVPGVAKTWVAKTFAQTLGCSFRRIQFTPDTLPADVVGSYVFDQKAGEFKLRRGPIFSNIVLIDEINRGTPKTQSATIEVMQERQVTIEGNTQPVDRPFMVLATINPVEVEGVYPLVTSQLDRCMLRLNVDYPSSNEDLQILENLREIEKSEVDQATDKNSVLQLIFSCENIHAAPQIMEYAANIIRATRTSRGLRLGGSPRAMIHLYKASKARALICKRGYVIPDDVKYLAPKILGHRLMLTPEAEVEGTQVKDLVDEVLSQVPIPKTEVK